MFRYSVIARSVATKQSPSKIKDCFVRSDSQIWNFNKNIKPFVLDKISHYRDLEFYKLDAESKKVEFLQGLDNENG